MLRAVPSWSPAERRADALADKAGAQQPVAAPYSATDEGRPLDPTSRASFEARLGHDLSRVRIHDGPRATAFARLVRARATTVGTDVFFATDQFRPGTLAGDRLLAHELTHAVDPQADPDAVHRQPQTGGLYDLAPDTVRAMLRAAFRQELSLAINAVALTQPLRNAEAGVAQSAIATWLSVVNLAESATVTGMSAVLPAALSGRITTVVRDYADVVRTVIGGLSSVAQGLEELSTVDVDGILDQAGLQADWLALTEVWFFEESPQALGQWGTCNGIPCVTINRPDYIDDLRSRPTYLEAVEAFKATHPDPSLLAVGTRFRHSFRFTGPGSASGQYNAVEWFLGSYTLDFTVTAVDAANRTLTVELVAANRSRWGSATRLPEEYRRRYGVPTELVPDMPRSVELPGGDVEQRFVWTDTIAY